MERSVASRCGASNIKCRNTPAFRAADLEFIAVCRSYLVRALVITGAGVSAESGIPTFRGKDGYWRNFDPTKLATPEAFARDPQLVWDWYRERRQRIRKARPNAGHEAIARLAQQTDEFLLVTQNVDDLHGRAGVQAQRMVRIHGDIFITRCSRCEFERHDYEGERQDAAAFGYIIDWALRASQDGCELIEVNPEETPLSRFATRLVREPAAIALPRIVDELVDRVRLPGL